jgi:8-oxo-dGTP pyrophosphatase MutT (NUDIX family)
MNPFNLCTCNNINENHFNYEILKNTFTTYNFQFNKNINNKKKIEQCGVILLNSEENTCLSCYKILIVQQKNSNKWGLPKGHLNIKEKNIIAFQSGRQKVPIIYDNFYECAKRELVEETGVIINDYDQEYIIETLLSNKIFYIIKISDINIIVNPIDTDEISDVKWCKFNELNNFIENNDCNKTIRDLNLLIKNYELNKKKNIIQNNRCIEYSQCIENIGQINLCCKVEEVAF